jgi:peptidoglycan hydrolase FlgJ
MIHQFLKKNPRYRFALAVASDPEQMAMQVARAGYATDPGYADTLLKVIRRIKQEIEKLGIRSLKF